MNKLGIFINFWENSWDVDHIKYMKKVKDIGFDILEFQAQPLLEMTNEHMDEMKKAAADLGIELHTALVWIHIMISQAEMKLQDFVV